MTANSDLKYILGAFVLAPKIKKLRLRQEILEEVTNIYVTLSKYSHKNLSKLYSSNLVKCVVEYFLENGMDHFFNEPLVMKHGE
mmetsp:Transcript_10534/g.11826  ORF Transcript_10534/g.11826 Transcript_10534/m.11826 type:complete len:84 (+) Transcript_10534:46-297(+)